MTADPIPTEIEAGAEAYVRALLLRPDDIRDWTDIQESYPFLVSSVRDATAAALRAVLPEHDEYVRAAERYRIHEKLRAMPCPNGERPGANVTADQHYLWMNDVLRLVAEEGVTK